MDIDISNINATCLMLHELNTKHKCGLEVRSMFSLMLHRFLHLNVTLIIRHRCDMNKISQIH